MRRVKFRQKGQQRKFLQEVLKKVNCPSLGAFEQFGFDIPYSTLKNYFSEHRLLPEDFFKELCDFAKIIPKNIEFLKDNWGQIKGGKKGKK